MIKRISTLFALLSDRGCLCLVRRMGVGHDCADRDNKGLVKAKVIRLRGR